jgi:actin-related protein
LLKEKSDEDSVKEYYSLPDGTPIQVGYERVKCPELLLNPTYFKSDKTSLLSVFESSCSKVDQHMKKDLLSNIVLAGGSFGFKGMEKRLHYEIKKIIGDKSLFGDQTKILCPPERTYSAWIGGSIVAAMPKTESWISKDDFDEYGREIVQQRLQ